MNTRDFLKAGHWPTLLAAFLYFDMSFMVWILLGPLGVQIAADLKLDPAAKGFMVALPVLAGALLRVVNGALVDRIGPKRAGLIGQVIVIVGLIAFWASGARSYTRFCRSAWCSASPAPRSPSPCRSLRAGIRRNIRAWRSASPAPAIPARCSPRCSRRPSPSPLAGPTSSGSPPSR